MNKAEMQDYCHQLTSDYHQSEIIIFLLQVGLVIAGKSLSPAQLDVSNPNQRDLYETIKRDGKAEHLAEFMELVGTERLKLELTAYLANLGMHEDNIEAKTFLFALISAITKDEGTVAEIDLDNEFEQFIYEQLKVDGKLDLLSEYIEVVGGN
ncbi:hypothetical protein [Ferrimonas marina]|uniref:Uncharacterized protein n=1 Tax=Ferrimonas marina TaxID=299255 RepID=A0A1M5TVV8_9GAMM|nr:hypothetical protein [Ferrimonas marina]SHH54922.1 hypothetical protein SAMN02745129_2299 [Ferrimonas marina]